MSTVAKRKYVTKRTVIGKGNSRYFHGWNKWNESDFIIGVYESDIVDNFKNTCPVIKVEEAHLSNPVTDRDGNTIDIVGKNLQLNSVGGVKCAFYEGNEKYDNQPIKKGEIVQVTYLGEKLIESGTFAGKNSHNLEVDVMVEEEAVVESEENDDLY